MPSAGRLHKAGESVCFGVKICPPAGRIPRSCIPSAGLKVNPLEVSMTDFVNASVFGALLGDSLALGVHWEYDAPSIRNRFGRIESLLPPAGSYHAGKEAGEFTHYGDQTMVLLRSVAGSGGFSLTDFSTRWRELFDSYEGYFDGATKMTLRFFEAGEGPESSGSGSSDLAGAARIAPLLAVYPEDVDGLIAASRAQTKMTHNNIYVEESAEFFARTAWHAGRGVAPVDAMRIAAEEGSFVSTPVGKWLDAGIESASSDTVAAIGRFGQSCNVNGAFSGVVHCIAKYPDDPGTALTECVMAGGDSAARALLVGTVLGAANGMASLPVEWLKALKARNEVESLLAGLG